MNVYDFAEDLDLSQEKPGSIFGVRGMNGDDNIVYAQVATVDCSSGGISCNGCIFYDELRDGCLAWKSDSCTKTDTEELVIYQKTVIK